MGENQSKNVFDKVYREANDNEKNSSVIKLLKDGWYSTTASIEEKAGLIKDFEEFIFGKNEFKGFEEFLLEAHNYLNGLLSTVSKTESVISDEKESYVLDKEVSSSDMKNSLIPVITVSIGEITKLLMSNKDSEISIKNLDNKIVIEPSFEDFKTSTNIQKRNSNKTAAVPQDLFRLYLGSIEENLKGRLCFDKETEIKSAFFRNSSYSDEAVSNVLNSEKVV